MSLPEEVEVLVVGAGPVGLTAAVALKKLGVDVAIVDQDIKNRNGARAAVMHARTLEVLETIGLAEAMLKNGIRSNYIKFFGRKNKLLDVDFSLLKGQTKYPCLLLISQQDIEQILRIRLSELGQDIFPHKVVVECAYQEATQRIHVSFQDGSSIRTKYLVGTDGGKSLIRKLANIPFTDPSSHVAYDETPASETTHFALADVYIEEPLKAPISDAAFTAHFDTFFFCIPMRSEDPRKGNRLWRFGFGTTMEDRRIGWGENIPPKPSKEYLQELLDRKNPWDDRIIIKEVLTSSRYRVKSAVAERYWTKIGNCDVLLAGDSAHVHTPVGGQGLNLGICDAVALAEAISRHTQTKRRDISGAGADTILQRYSDQRYTIGCRVVGLTKRLNRMVLWGYGWRRLVRNFIMAVMIRVPKLMKLLAWRMSGLVNRDA